MSIQEQGWFAAHHPEMGAVILSDHPLPQLLSRGTLMLEFSLMRGEQDILPLLHHVTRSDWQRFLSVSFTHDGHLCVSQRQGDAFHALSIDATEEILAGGRMRLTWSWDAPARTSLLTLEALDNGSIRQRHGHAPLPLMRDDAEALTSGSDTARIGPRVEWLALSDAVHPVGPGACFAPATMIETPTGPRPAASLRAGDLVETVDAGAQPVVWSGRVSLPALGSLCPVRLCAPSFGATRDLWLMPEHRVVVGGPVVDYLFGKEEVLVPARYLVDGCTALQPDRPSVLGWHGILLADHHLLMSDGCLIESLSIGALARHRSLAANTVLADLAKAGKLPTHPRRARPVLKSYEAMTLAAARAQKRGPVAA